MTRGKPIQQDVEDETINLPDSVRRAVQKSDDIEEISAEEDSDSTQARPRAQALPKPAIGSHRPATRAVPMPPTDDDATLRHAALIKSVSERRGKDEDLDLFTDDAPRKRR